ncbi:MAG: RnfABCDGE type electron transport complex subunit D [Treponema sp.]|nr:RnfABCDGE type electron transport complex subunit D [Treponema sp.]
MTRVRNLVLGQAPHIYNSQSTSSLTWGMSLALVPAAAWGIYCYGAAAALAIASAIASACMGELAVGGLSRRFTLGNGSAFLTGFLIGMAMPPNVPLYIPIASSLFAVLIVKAAFGGLGSNWMNPALAGIAFALLDWPKAMNAWTLPRNIAGVVGVGGATPLEFVRQSLAAAAAGSSPLDILKSAGFRFSGLDHRITDFLNQLLFTRIGSDMPSGYFDLLIGNKSGAPGELSGILILAASIVLLARSMIRWEIPTFIVAVFSALTWVFGGLPYGSGFFSGDVLFSLLTGSFLLVTFFMATDPVTSPSTRIGMFIYGGGIAIITFLIRSFGSMSEGMAFAVLVMNCLVPLLDRRRAPLAGGTPLGAKEV